MCVSQHVLVKTCLNIKAVFKMTIRVLKSVSQKEYRRIVQVWGKSITANLQQCAVLTVLCRLGFSQGQERK